jgi:dolichol-phosphate mannosyltransferase
MEKLLTKNPEVSVAIPVYNEENNLAELYKQLKFVLETKLKVTYEIIFVDDGSEDSSWNVIVDLCSQNKNVKGIKLSRNFGHQQALKAGLDYSIGKAVISMDSDLQHPPEIIEKFYEEWEKGYDIVCAIRKDTKGIGLLKKVSSKFFYTFMNFLSDTKIEEGSSDFRLLDRKVVDEVKKFSETHLFLRGIISWIGHKSTAVEYLASQRYSGKSKYTIKKMLHFALDGIMSFSIRPLRVAMACGFFISVFSFLYILYALISKFVLKTTLAGWTSILISVLFLGGIQLLSIGILGEYLGKLFIESKKRRNYIIEKFYPIV